MTMELTLEQTLRHHGYYSEKGDSDDGRRTIYHESGCIETRANAKEAWAWLRLNGLIKA
jgi:hypothetical protein